MLFVILAILSLQGTDASAPAYPSAPPGDVIDDYFGTPVPDPYRWLEDVDSESTSAWITSQQDLWDQFLEETPESESFHQRLLEVIDYQRRTMPYRRAGRYYFYTNDGLQDHSVFCSSRELNSEAEVVIDPNLFPGERDCLAGTFLSNNGSVLAWGTSTSGSDWNTIHFRDLCTGEELTDSLTWLKGGVSWARNNSGVYYSSYDVPEEGKEYTDQNTNERIMFHRLGTPQEADSLIYERPDQPGWTLWARETEDGNYLIIWIRDTTISGTNALYYIDLNSPGNEVVELFSDFDAVYSLAGNVGSTFYIKTDLDAPNNRVISLDLDSPEQENWVEVVPESDEVLSYASVINRNRSLVLQYKWGGYNSVYRCSLDGSGTTEISMPVRGSIWGFYGRQTDTETFYTFSSFLHPGEIWRYDFETGESTLLWTPEINCDLSGITEKQVFYESHDGTRIPMFLVYPSDMPMDGSTPLLLYGYGGFGVSMGPWFNTTILPWIEMGGAYAMPCIRGGGEYGEPWHQAGIRENRPVVFEDFISAAEYLIEEGYTSREHIGISGGSNGGTLVAACLNMRPGLFAAAAPAMGVMDLMRFHLFTIGWYWKSEYGDPENPDDIEFLLDYSPYHNITEGTEYPPVLVSTADHDDRVVPGHSFKYGARLQAAQAGSAPIFMAIHQESGHGGAVGLSERLQRKADEYAFFWTMLN